MNTHSKSNAANEFYKQIPATRFSKARRVRVKAKVIEELSDGSFRVKNTGRMMTLKTFEVFKTAAALDGINLVIVKIHDKANNLAQ